MNFQHKVSQNSSGWTTDEFLRHWQRNPPSGSEMQKLLLIFAVSEIFPDPPTGAVLFSGSLPIFNTGSERL